MHQRPHPLTCSGTSLQGSTPSQLSPGPGSPRSPGVVGAERAGGLDAPQGWSSLAVMDSRWATLFTPPCPHPLAWKEVGEEEEWERGGKCSGPRLVPGVHRSQHCRPGVRATHLPTTLTSHNGHWLEHWTRVPGSHTDALLMAGSPAEPRVRGEEQERQGQQPSQQR